MKANLKLFARANKENITSILVNYLKFKIPLPKDLTDSSKAASVVSVSFLKSSDCTIKICP
ncbi:hypothetical protein D3C72_1202960 [compost metagenome]